MSDVERALALIERVIPFRFLGESERRALAERLEYRSFAPGDVIIRQGDRDREVYLLERGTVSIVSPREPQQNGAPRRITSVDPGHYFGEWEPLFETGRTYDARADGEVEAFCVSGDYFLELVNSSPALAQGLGTLLRDRQGVFAAFDRFKAELIREVTQGHIIIEKLLRLYRNLEPALHAGIMDETRLDIAALSYSVRRLPENITRTFALLFTDELTGAYADPDAYFPSVPSAARRREVWEMLPGKNLVLIRNGLSDLFDLVTCLCTYSIEAEKLRKRLNTSANLKRISQYLREAESDDRAFLAQLPFSEEEVDGLCRLWPGEAVKRVFDVLRHREMFSVDVRRRVNTYNSRRAELWTAQVAAATRRHIGYDPSCLPDDVEVHIISSNTHSVTNCLNPWYRRHGAELLDWGRSHRQEIVETGWENDDDLRYALARDYFTDNPKAAEESRRIGAEHGIMRLESTASTGIQVQLIDATQLSAEGLDPGIGPPVRGGRSCFIVNIDYAFGEQAEHIMRNLLMLFGRNVASINFLGKAGALVGRRGDVLRPTAFIEQSSDLFQPIPSDAESHRRLERRLGTRHVHSGPMLTVEGTLLQNRLMLHFYRRIWGCTGLEMEGTFYYRQVLESTQLGVIRPDVAMRFFYYVSDLPLSPHGSLSSRLQLSEGVPPLYAITRHILDEVFRDDHEPKRRR